MPVPEISPPINSQNHAILVLPWLYIHCGVEIAFEYSVHEQGLLYLLLPYACQKVRHIHRVLRKVMPRMHGAFEDQAKIHYNDCLATCRQDALSHATLAGGMFDYRR